MLCTAAVRTGKEVMQLETGMVLNGKYRILKALGKGGEGSVWLALHLQTEQLWAVKKIPRKENGKEFHELNMMKKLRHRCLPQILDVLEGEQCIYLVMEYVRGHTLEEIKQKKGRLTPEQVMEVGLELSDVLSYLHGRKFPIFHLDIKPANIIQRKDGTLVLVDFGSAWKRQENGKETVRKGTEGFAAPEQYDLNRPVDERSDIYGLGATLYYLISGVRYSEVMQKSRIPGCPEYMSEVIRRCVRAEPEMRYPNCKRLYRDMAKWKKKYQSSRERSKIWAALLLAIFTLGIAFREIPEELTRRGEESWNYEKLLAEALCSTGEESFAYYTQALFCAPGRKQAYLQYLEQADSDGVMSKMEEEQFRVLLHTIPLGKEETYEELLAKNPSAYGEVAFRLGMLYWYSYELEDGRRIAAGWLTKAETALQKLSEKRERKEWEVQTEIFTHMSTYFESLGTKNEAEEKQGLEIKYWEDLNRILEMEEIIGNQKLTELKFLKETLNQLIFLSEDLWRAGISQGEQENLVTRIAIREKNLISETQGRELELKQEISALVETAETVIAHLQQKTQVTVNGNDG